MPSRGVSHFMLKWSLTSFEGSLVLRPRGEYSSAPHVGMAYAHIAKARVCLVGMQSVRTAGLGRASDECDMYLSCGADVVCPEALGKATAEGCGYSRGW